MNATTERTIISKESIHVNIFTFLSFIDICKAASAKCSFSFALIAPNTLVWTELEKRALAEGKTIPYPKPASARGVYLRRIARDIWKSQQDVGQRYTYMNRIRGPKPRISPRNYHISIAERDRLQKIVDGPRYHRDDITSTTLLARIVDRLHTMKSLCEQDAHILAKNPEAYDPATPDNPYLKYEEWLCDICKIQHATTDPFLSYECRSFMRMLIKKRCNTRLNNK